MTNLGPYRTPGITLDNILDKTEQVGLIKSVLAKGEFDINYKNYLLEILGDSGYECNDSDVYLRYQKTAPVLPGKHRHFEDRFVALIKKGDLSSLLISGSYNGDISGLNRNLDAIMDIDSAYSGRVSALMGKANKTLGYAYKGIVGTALSASLIAGSPITDIGIALCSLLGFAAGAYYVNYKFKPVSKETIGAAKRLSADAKNYIFNNKAMIKLETEASQIRGDRKKHQMFRKLYGKIPEPDLKKQ